MNQATLEALLAEGYRNQTACYTEAVAAVRAARAVWQSGADLPALLQPVVGALDRAARIEAALAPTRQQWQQAGRRCGPGLESLLAALAQLLRELIQEVAALERLACDFRSELLPELESLRLGQQMQRAYALGGAAPQRV